MLFLKYIQKNFESKTFDRWENKSYFSNDTYPHYEVLKI